MRGRSRTYSRCITPYLVLLLLLLLLSAGMGCNRESRLSLQTQIDAADPGSTITIEPGRYSGSLYIAKPIVLSGTGASAEDVSIVGSLPGAPTIEIDGDVLVEVRGLTVQDGVGGVVVRGSAELSLVDVRIVDSLASGISLSDTAVASLQDCTITGSGHNGVSLADSASLYAVRSQLRDNEAVGVAASTRGTVAIEDSTIASNGECGVELRRSTRAEFHDVELLGNGYAEKTRTIIAFEATSGLWLSGSSQTLLDGCSVRGNCGIGVLLDESAYLRTQETEILSNGGAGVAADASADAELVGGLIRENDQMGVGAWDASHVVLREARIEHNGSQGVLASGGPQVELYDCTISGNGYGGVATYTPECFEECAEGVTFYGQVIGLRNRIPGVHEGFGNTAFSTCPESLEALLLSDPGSATDD